VKPYFAFIVFSFAASAASSSDLFELFGIQLGKSASDYTVSQGQSDAYAGQNYMEVSDFTPPIINRDFKNYTLSYHTTNRDVAYVNGWVQFGSLESCKESARVIAPKLEKKYGIKYELEESTQGTNFYFQYSHFRDQDYSNVLCYISGGYGANLIVEIGTNVYMDALNNAGDNF
jgi:hypothetical protein